MMYELVAGINSRLSPKVLLESLASVIGFAPASDRGAIETSPLVLIVNSIDVDATKVLPAANPLNIGRGFAFASA